MPELAEVKIMSEFINQFSDKIFTKIVFTKYSKKDKLKNDSYFDAWNYQIKSKSRGKELNISIYAFPKKGYLNKETNFYFLIALGMTGNFIYSLEIPKATRFYLTDESGYSLCFVDPRKFATIKDFSPKVWSENRGPDPTYEFIDFKQNIIKNLNKPIFKNKPLYEILMDQRYFNGIGNYLRAEIIGRGDFNPFSDLISLSKSFRFDQLLQLCKEIPLEAYSLGGGQLKDWQNPNHIDKNQFIEWLQFYRKKDKCRFILDSSGRRFWINRKINSLPYRYYLENNNEIKKYTKEEMNNKMSDFLMTGVII